ncbi:MAG TPA: RHS repeat-associated core domain-containing protein, partial [Promineifilum sp.]|nr:RHS repeat-associated core domain-containing protein [Promineifilum sp.]
DAEGASWQNWFRTYDGSVGRYTQSDPIGLAGGLNTYAYATSNPLSLVDPAGLETLLCSRELGGPDRPAMPPSGTLFRHDYLIVDGKVQSFQRGENYVWSKGEILSNESTENSKCVSVSKDPEFDRAVEAAIEAIGEPAYNFWAYPNSFAYVFGARNCQSWASDVLHRALRIHNIRRAADRRSNP